MALTEQDEQRAMTFSEAIRAASWEAHEHAEQSRFMGDLLAGKLGIDRYAELVAQTWFVYDRLESAGRRMADDPVAGVFVAPELERGPALEADLDHLLGPGWRDRVRPTASTAEYCERLDQATSWSGGFVAHHYVRYLGDLSGGQVIRRVVERVYELPDHRGTSFYVFDRIPDLKAFKQRYRTELDVAPWSSDEKERVIDEVLAAYQLNTGLLDALAA